MANNDDTQKPASNASPQQQNDARKPVRDIPHLIKLILLILLLLLLAAEITSGEFSKLSDGFIGWPWFIIIIQLSANCCLYHICNYYFLSKRLMKVMKNLICLALHFFLW